LQVPDLLLIPLAIMAFSDADHTAFEFTEELIKVKQEKSN